jgi:NitT/TauT family transport system permease protein
MLLSIIVLVLLWKVLSLWVDLEIILPSPEATGKKLWALVQQEYYWFAIYYTLKRTVLCFLFSLLLALLVGVLATSMRPFYYLFHPMSLVMKATPTMSIILLALIWLESERAPYLVGFLVVFPILYANVIQGIHNIDQDLINMAKVYNIKKIRIIGELYIPSMVSYLFAGMISTFGLNLKVMVAAEVLSQPKIAIGRYLQMEKVYLDTAGVLAWTLSIILLVALFEGILRSIQNKLENWK